MTIMKMLIKRQIFFVINLHNINEPLSSRRSAVNGLGGVYANEYSYDDMYRLIGASGTFTDKNSTDFPFTLEMSYTASGNIATKNVAADILSADNTVSQTVYEGNYSYTSGKPHAIEYINGNGIDQAFTWDLNGNLSTHSDNIKSLNRYLCWDEENHEEYRTRNIEHRIMKYL